MNWLLLMIFLPFIFAIIVPALYKIFNPRIHTGWFVLVVPTVIFIYLLSVVPSIYNMENILVTVPWIPSYDLNFTAYIDGLSLVFGLLIAGIGALVILYSIYYMSKLKEALHNFYVYLLLFMGAMLGLVFSDNIIILYVFWELTSISSFLLIAYWYQRKASRYGAQKSLLITVFGGLAMLAGFIMLSMMADTYSIREIWQSRMEIVSNPLFVPSMILILLGAFTKSAQFPFSIWLPGAMEAPTPISAYLHSATMVKAGIYLVARFTPVFGGSMEWFWIITIIGVTTLIYGSLTAVKQVDLKALLAYSTISQLGLIMSLLGLGSAAMYFEVGSEAEVFALAILTAIFHLINHSTFKGSLFMVVGIIDHETGTRDIRKLGGLISLMPISFTLALIGSFSMAGLPPFNGFLSKEMFFTSFLKVTQHGQFGISNIGTLLLIIIWIASVFTFIYSMILVFKTFLGKHQPEKLDKVVHEAPIGMLISPIVLASLVVIIFIFPNELLTYIMQPALIGVLPHLEGGIEGLYIKAWHGWNTELYMTIGVAVLGTLLYKTYKKWSRLFYLYPNAITLNNIYNASLVKAESTSKKITDRYMTGLIRDYLVYIMFAFIVLVGGTAWLLNGISFDMSNDAPISIYEGVLLFGIIISTLLILFTNSRLTAVIGVGALGYIVSLLFVVFRAPDLALTQLVVETVTAALFLLCFYHLPELRKQKSKVRHNTTNWIISIGVGVTVTIVALAANGNRLFEPISNYFENAYELAGAKNIVNAILVDFRGVDTLLEILVLCIAGLGVYTLVKLNLERRDRDETK
ncbi:Na+/H+ antiporter subunit A [Sutcliffiella cohnii]